MNDLILPTIDNLSIPHIGNILNTLSLPRDVLASDEEINYAWKDLPRELKKIMPELRDELIARMCIAISVGLFDSAINYIWNSSIRRLRRKIIHFGLNVVKQIKLKDFDEIKLNEMRDADLLSLCLELNLISEEGYFFLDQCRDTRNNYSAAHPTISLINDRELIVYINRCAKYALSEDIILKGVDFSKFLEAIKGYSFSDEQLTAWVERLNNTHSAQRETLLLTTHGIYCDPSSGEEARNNSLALCIKFSQDFSDRLISNILNRHNDYQANGDTKRFKASRIFFEKLNMLSLLNTSEQHSIISKACSNLMSAHKAFYNFQNEPPFANRLVEITKDIEVPDSTKREFVLAVITCYIGNQYGISFDSIKYYEKLIKSFSPKEILLVFSLLEEDPILKIRLKSTRHCQEQRNNIMELLDEKSIPPSVLKDYKKYKKKVIS